MGLVTDAVQIGQHATATNNFTLLPNNDGSMTLARGNVGATTQDLLKIDANGKILFLSNAQTLTDVKTTPGRVANTPYTNNTPLPIDVMVTAAISVAGAEIAFNINGVKVMDFTQTSAYNCCFSARIYPGETYSVTSASGTPSIARWWERR